jgi:hypothetical protein
MFDFPASPADGTIYAPPTGPQYQYSGGAWRVASAPSAGLPPADGYEYSMSNGVWRLSKQRFSTTGLTQLDIPVPTWAGTARLIVFHLPNGTSSDALRFSDGTTVYAGATDYQIAGWQHSTGTGGFLNFAQAGATMLTLNNSGNSTVLGMVSEITVKLDKVGGHAVRFHWRGETFNSVASTLFNSIQLNGYVNNAGLDRVRMIRWLANSVAPTDGYITAEWLP